MRNLYFLFLVSALLACKKVNTKNISKTDPKTFSYSEMKAPSFFESLVSNHLKDFHSINHDDVETLFEENNISTSDSLNLKKFYTITILHKLFTSKSAQNGSKGDILNIPYFWHWITPNPRHEIIDLKTNQKLNNTKPPKEFSKYKSKADVDRTPYLFLSELLSEKPLYNTTSCGNFSSFGWCSEREMAFVCLLNTMNYKGKVITNSNHSWSEFIISLNSKTNQSINFKVKVDNTFDFIEWKKISTTEITAWDKQTFQGQGNWYNQKALSLTEKQNVTNIIISPYTSKNIEEKVVPYLKER